jgi:ferredoxin
MHQIIFYRGKCIGCNACAEAAPDRWTMSRKDGRCNLIDSTQKKGIYRTRIQEYEVESNLTAARNCPVSVIKVEQI